MYRAPVASVDRVFQEVNGLVMFVAPGFWYLVTPGTDYTGPLSTHFVQDIGLGFLATAAPLGLASQAIDSRFLVLTAIVFLGDPGPPERVLSDDIELASDDGGKALATRYTLTDRDPVDRFLLGVSGNYDPAVMTVESAVIDAHPGIVIRENGVVIATMSRAVGKLDRITGVCAVRNPDKLAALRPSIPVPHA